MWGKRSKKRSGIPPRRQELPFAHPTPPGRDGKRRSFPVLRGGAMLLVAFILGSGLIMLALAVMGSAALGVAEVVVRGNSRVPPAQIIAAANITIGANILGLKRQRIVERITANPWIKEAFVGNEFPSRVVLEVRERKPIAILKGDNGFSLIDKGGEVFRPSSFAGELRLPVLTGDYKTFSEDPSLYSRTQEIINFLSQNATVLKWEHVAEIHIDKIYGFSLLTDDGLLVQVGFGDYREKFYKLEKTLSHYGGGGGMVFDLNGAGKVFVRKQRGGGAAPIVHVVAGSAGAAL